MTCKVMSGHHRNRQQDFPLSTATHENMECKFKINKRNTCTACLKYAECFT